MQKLILFILICSFANNTSLAHIRRVGSSSTKDSVDYSSLQAAVSASADGDTIYMYPGKDMGAAVNKKITIVGPGYFLNPADPNYPGNGGLQIFTTTTSPSGYFELQAGSEGSEIYGCNFELPGGLNYQPVTFNGTTGNILFKRCRFKVNSTYPSIFFNTNCSQVSFEQCVIDGNFSVINNISVSNLNISNSILLASGNLIFAFNRPGTVVSGVVQNCVFESAGAQSDFGNGNWLIGNCISRGNGFTGANLTYTNNIGTGTEFPADNGNQRNMSWETIFNLTGSWDGRYRLKTGSPALKAGTGGIDCGIFGGNAPYRLSGIPPFPTIYALGSEQGNVPSGNTIRINFSTRSNN